MEEKESETRACTAVLFLEDWTQGRARLPLTLTTRSLDIKYQSQHRVFKADLSKTKASMRDLLVSLLKTEELLKSAGRVAKARKPKATWKETVNLKRKRIAEVLSRSPSSSIKKLAKEAGCHESTMRSAIKDRELKKARGLFEYNNQHSQEVVEAFDCLAKDTANQFSSISDLKRAMQIKASSSVSRKWIAKRLRHQGLRYLKLRRERRIGDQRKFDEGQLRRVVWTAAQAWKGDNELMFFMDEAEFPLYATADYCWCKPGDRPVYNRRILTKRSLHVIAICNNQSIFAVQILDRPYNKQSIHYFLVEVLKRLDPDQEVVVMLDNASPHASKLIVDSNFKDVLLFNVAYCWEANLIENTFAKLKALWRQRKVTDKIEEEVESLAKILLEPTTSRDFAGYRRQYLRQLLELVDKRLPA